MTGDPIKTTRPAGQIFVTNTSGYHYLLHLPAAYDAEERWPLLLFLHGAGERGQDPALLKNLGIPKLVETQPDFPFVAISPQCQAGHYWNTVLLRTNLGEAMRRYRIDTRRIYLTGVSMGGYATWKLAIEETARFAAIAPVCGGGEPRSACRLKHVPVWAFHGARDEVVPLSETEAMVDALKACGGDVRLTVYPDAGHDAWTATYANPELYAWFRSHSRP
jgi:predicted peptidase